MSIKTKNNEMHTNFYSILLAIFLALTALVLYKNVTSPVRKNEENKVIEENKNEVKVSSGNEKSNENKSIVPSISHK
jgi:hypothetical protein